MSKFIYIEGIGRLILNDALFLIRNNAFLFYTTMDPMFLVAVIVTLIYALVKFGEYKFLQRDDEKTPLKDIVREIIIVAMSSLAASYIYFHFQGTINEFFNVVTDAKVLNQANTQVFTDKPNF